MKKVCGNGQSTPCYQNGVHCQERKLGCHATCERYMKSWTFNNEVVYPNRAKNSVIYDYTCKEIQKSINRGGKKR